MNLSLDFHRLLPIVAVGVVALAAAVLVTRGLGGGSTSASAQQVLDRAVKEQPTSAALNMRVGFSLQTGGKSVTVADTVISGAGADTAPGKPRRASARFTERIAGKEPVSLDELSTGERGYIQVAGRWYQLTDSQYKRVFPPERNASFTGTSNLDPRRWIRNPRLQTTNAQVGGVTANHVSGDVNADALLADLGFYKTDATGSPQARQFADTLRNATKRGTMSLYAGKQDGILRKLSVNAEADAAKRVPPVKATITFALGLDKVNQPVTVQAPKGALPAARIADVPRAKLGTQADGILGPQPTPAQKPSRPSRHAARKPSTPSRHARKPKKTPAPAQQRKPARSAKAYVSCVQVAQDLQALQRCQALLP